MMAHIQMAAPKCATPWPLSRNVSTTFWNPATDYHDSNIERHRRLRVPALVQPGETPATCPRRRSRTVCTRNRRLGGSRQPPAAQEHRLTPDRSHLAPSRRLRLRPGKPPCPTMEFCPNLLFPRHFFASATLNMTSIDVRSVHMENYFPYLSDTYLQPQSGCTALSFSYNRH